MGFVCYKIANSYGYCNCTDNDDSSGSESEDPEKIKNHDWSKAKNLRKVKGGY